MDILNCKTCKRCNSKGLPSVSKYSSFCELQRKNISVKESLLSIIKKRLFEKRFDKETKNIKSKGFRSGWFWK